MDVSLHLRAAGGLLILIGLAHLPYYWILGWKDELPRLTPLTRQIFLVHVFFLSLWLVFLGAASLVFPWAFLEPNAMVRLVLAGTALTWGVRFAFQLAIYDPAHWRGNTGRTLAHFGFLGIWAYLAAVYGLALRTVW
jgi:hypothetical protein